MREEEDELPDVELDENNSTEVNKSKLKHVTVKPQEKVPRWNNERLYPPSSKCKSKAWQFGGFLKDSKTGQLLTQKTVCGFCGLKQNYRCSPTNLDQHMAAAHSLEYEGVGLKIKERSKMEDFFQPKTNIKYKSSHPKQMEVRKALGEWVIESNRPLEAVEDPKLVKAFLAADPKIKVPTARMIRNDIGVMYKEKEAKFLDEISKVEFFAGNNDAGSSTDNRSFVVVNTSYVTEDFQLKKKVLDMFEMPEAKNAKNYRKRVDNTMNKFGVKEKTFVQTTDNEATMKAEFGKEERTGVLHTSSLRPVKKP